MLSKAKVLNGMQAAMPDARLTWHTEEEGRATLIVTLEDAEHYVGLDLTVPGLSADELVHNICEALQ